MSDPLSPLHTGRPATYEWEQQADRLNTLIQASSGFSVHRRKLTFETVGLDTGVDFCDLVPGDALMYFGRVVTTAWVSASGLRPFVVSGTAAMLAANAQIAMMPLNAADRPLDASEPAIHSGQAIAWNLAMYIVSPVTLQLKLRGMDPNDGSFHSLSDATAGEAWVYLVVVPGFVLDSGV